MGLPMLRLGKNPFAPAVIVFGFGQSPSSTAYESVCTIRFAHTTYSFRSSTYFPHRFSNQKSMPGTKRSLYFLLPCGGCATCLRLLSLAQKAMNCFAVTNSRFIFMPRKTSYAYATLRIFNTHSVAPVNAWRRSVAQKCKCIEMF